MSLQWEALCCGCLWEVIRSLPVALGEVCTPLPACGEEVEEGTSRRGVGRPTQVPK